MSGYLDHMLARAFGSGPVLRPRPRSRFEPTVAGPSDLAVWAESTDTPVAERPQPPPADGPAEPNPDPGPRTIPGTAPEPRPGRGRVRPQPTPRAVAGPEPFGDRQAVGPFGIKDPDTERTSSDQPPTDLTSRRTGPVTAVGTPARLPSGIASADPTTEGTGLRPAADSPEPGDPAPARHLPPPRAAPETRRPPGPVPADPVEPAPATTVAHSRPSRPAARRHTGRVLASDGEPSPVSPRSQAVADTPMQADSPVVASVRDVPDALVAAQRPTAAGSPEPAETSARTHPLARAPVGPPASVRAPVAADPADMTGDPLADLLAIPDPVAAAPTEAPKRTSPSRDIAPAPVVNVTIGRVEVRQPPAPPPSPPVRSPGPRPLSLDEYLERRNSGPS
jgi:hypothetical protein